MKNTKPVKKREHDDQTREEMVTVSGDVDDHAAAAAGAKKRELTEIKQTVFALLLISSCLFFRFVLFFTDLINVPFSQI